MYSNRVIPCLLLHNQRLVKTVGFGNENYIGDPINAVKIFNEKAVDEIIIIDIRKSIEGSKPDFSFLKNLAGQCFMPVAYGGGISSLGQIKKVFEIGMEKVVLNSMAFLNPMGVKKAVHIWGAQSIVGAMDVKRGMFGQYTVYTNCGRHNTRIDPVVYARYLEKIGVGEIFLNNITLDGKMTGYDLKLLKAASSAVTIPVTACGGAGSVEDLAQGIRDGGISAAAAGSLFVYLGNRKSILINYPDRNIIRGIQGE